MDTEKLIKKFSHVFQEITRRAYDNQEPFPGGGQVHRSMVKFVTMMSKEYGEISDERVVDYCIALLHYRKGREYVRINLVFGPKSIERYKGFSKGKRYFEDEWLESFGLSRGKLLAGIADRSRHNHSKYIYIASEDITKERAVTLGLAPFLCYRTSTMWTPFSPVCLKCGFQGECADETKRLFPEIYRLRKEEWQKNKER